MALAEELPPDASTASTGLRVNYLKNWVYAYSGTFNPTASATTYLNFTSGSGIIVGDLEINADWAGTGGNNITIEVYFNAIRIIFERDVANDFVPGDATYKLIIPPFTKVQIDLTGSTAPANANFTGRVYDA